jgi:hypothetical protein
MAPDKKPYNEPGNGPDGPGDADKAREDYRACWLTWRKSFGSGDFAAANEALIRADELAQRWLKAGRLEELLEPLLADTEVPDVRGPAARELLSHKVNENALATLHQLSDSDDPRVVKFATRALNETTRLRQRDASGG